MRNFSTMIWPQSGFILVLQFIYGLLFQLQVLAGFILLLLLILKKITFLYKKNYVID